MCCGTPRLNNMTQRPSAVICFRPHAWLRLSSLAVAIALAAVAVFLQRREGVTSVVVCCALLSGVAALGFVQALTTYVRLDEESLVIASGLRMRRYARQDLESVTWAAGCGVAVRRTDGTWLKLPELGRDSQALCNSLRAWLRRTQAGNAGHAAGPGPAP